MELKFNEEPLKDSDWERVHSFTEGWGWERRKDGVMYFLTTAMLGGLKYADLSDEEKIEIVIEYKKEIENKPWTSLASFEQYTFPNIKKTFPPLNLKDDPNVEP
jgi:hypothetical protein